MNVLFSATAPGITVAATDSALSAVALPAGDGNSVRIVNESADIAFVALGASTVAATLPTTGVGARTCTPVLPGTEVIMRRDPAKHTHISTICRSTKTATLTVHVDVGGR
ncbi:hypothetical protein [Herbaspirillum sp. ST 5-3]|uniref:hypothetical protein n=1 Tax=Oxalobacteraceae TaxID=75682 RepID=UPI0010A3D939|nr:hypothetical protein [Herbaspirillum sp. ST 5-3]